MKLRHDTMHFLDKYEDPSALKPTTTGAKGPKLAKKTCTLQHGWRGPKSTVSMTRFAEFVVKIGGRVVLGSARPRIAITSTCSSSRSKSGMKVTHGDSI